MWPLMSKPTGSHLSLDISFKDAFTQIEFRTAMNLMIAQFRVASHHISANYCKKCISYFEGMGKFSESKDEFPGPTHDPEIEARKRGRACITALFQEIFRKLARKLNFKVVSQPPHSSLGIRLKSGQRKRRWSEKETSHHEVSLPFSAQHHELASLAKQPVPAWLSTTNQEATWARFARQKTAIHTMDLQYARLTEWRFP